MGQPDSVTDASQSHLLLWCTTALWWRQARILPSYGYSLYRVIPFWMNDIETDINHWTHCFPVMFLSFWNNVPIVQLNQIHWEEHLIFLCIKEMKINFYSYCFFPKCHEVSSLIAQLQSMYTKVATRRPALTHSASCWKSNVMTPHGNRSINTTKWF